MRRIIVATISLPILLLAAAAPIVSVTIKRSDGTQKVFAGDQLAGAAVALANPSDDANPVSTVGTLAAVSVGAVTLRSVAGNAAVGTFDANGNLAVAAGAPVYVNVETIGVADHVEFKFADGTKYTESAAPWTYGLQFKPAGWNPVAGLYVLTITPLRAGKYGSPRIVRLTVSAAVRVAPAATRATTLPATLAGWYVRTDEGFTDFPLAPGAREYFVATSGNDSNSGDISAPLRTLQRAVNLCRNSGDRVRPFAGSKFYGQVDWRLSAPDGFYGGIIAYGEGERPRLETSGNGITTPAAVRNVAYSGLDIASTTRDPSLPTFDKKALEFTGIDVRNPGSQNVLIEDCRLRWFGNNAIVQCGAKGKYHDGVTFNRNIVLDSWAPRTFGGQGFYCDSTRHLQATGNFYDHCGWLVAPQVGVNIPPTEFRHANYWNMDCADAVARGNWLFRPAAFGIQDRGGGDQSGNMFWDCGNAANMYGRSGLFKNNVVLGGHARADADGIPATTGGSGIIAGSSSTSIESNYFWGRTVDQMPGMKFPSPAASVAKNEKYSLAGAVNWNMSGNGFVYWPTNKSLNNLNQFTLFGGDVHIYNLSPATKAKYPALLTNFQAKAPDVSKVWPTQEWIDALRNRPLRNWVTRGTPAQVFAEFQAANGR